MTRRTTGGSVRHHATRNLWEARYTGSDGRRHFRLYAPTERHAQERLRAALGAADHGIRPVGMQLTTDAYLGEWIEMSVRQRCRPRTAESYADTVTRYLVPAIGRVPLAKLEPEHSRGLNGGTNWGAEPSGSAVGGLSRAQITTPAASRCPGSRSG